jgi:hypothetical protein
MVSKRPPEPTIQDIYETASASVAAQTLLDAMKPQLSRAVEGRLKALFDAPPELGALLDARAQLKAIWDMKFGLERDAKKGAKAVEIMNNLLVAAANKS